VLGHLIAHCSFFLQAEYRQHHKITNPVHIIGFLSQWKMYLNGLLQGKEVKNFKGKKLDPMVCWICFFFGVGRSKVYSSCWMDPCRCQVNSWDNSMGLCMLPRMCGNLYQKTQSCNIGPRNDMVYQVDFLSSS